MHRDATPEDFVGKTIAEFDGSSINIWRFVFTDGTRLAIELETFGEAGYGMVICDECTNSIN